MVPDRKTREWSKQKPDRRYVPEQRSTGTHAGGRLSSLPKFKTERGGRSSRANEMTGYCIECGVETFHSAFCAKCDPVALQAASLRPAPLTFFTPGMSTQASITAVHPPGIRADDTVDEGFFDSYFNAWAKVFDFSGRARRREYSLFVLINFVATVTGIFAAAFVTGFLDLPDSYYNDFTFVLNITTSLIAIPVTVRRFHDLGRSGWYIFRMPLLITGLYYTFILFFHDGDDGTNDYGPSPKYRQWQQPSYLA